MPSTLSTVQYLLATSPNWAEKLTGWSTFALAVIAVLALFGALIGAWFARRSIKEGITSRHAQIALEVTQRWDQDIRSVKRAVAKVPREKLPKRVLRGAKRKSREFYEFERLANYFEQLGTLYKLGALELDWINEMLGSSVMDYWELWRPIVLVDRPKLPKLYENWELLAGDIQRHRTLQAIARGGRGSPRVSMFILRYLLHYIERHERSR